MASLGVCLSDDYATGLESLRRIKGGEGGGCLAPWYNNFQDAKMGALREIDWAFTRPAGQAVLFFPEGWALFLPPIKNTGAELSRLLLSFPASPLNRDSLQGALFNMILPCLSGRRDQPRAPGKHRLNDALQKKHPPAQRSFTAGGRSALS